MNRHAPTSGIRWSHRSGQAPPHRSLVDRLRGLLSLLVLLALLVGVPAALIALRGNPLPDTGLDPGALVGALTRPDDGSLFLTALTFLAWAGWATFALSVLVEVPAQVRGLPSPHLPALGLQQRAASSLLAGAALLFTLPLAALSSPALSSPALSAETRPAAAPVSTTPNSTASASPDTATEAAATPTTAATGTAVGSSQTSAKTYTVLPGDSLWQIAQDQLGDGARYSEIAQLNYGATQPDGMTLTTDHWLRPGWTLTLPADATTRSTPAATTTVVVVEPGDTLWEIAEDTLGDGSRYHEIADASTGLQPDGDRLTDPDLIRPGWQLTVPGAQAAAPGPATAAHAPLSVERPPAGAPSVEAPPTEPPAAPPVAAPELSETQIPATGRPGSAEQRRPQTQQAPGQEIADDEDPVAVRTAAGIGALLAAGLLVLLGAKRARQQRRRRPGQRIAMPPPDLAPAELDLRLVEDPAGLGRVDQALRALSVLLGLAGRALPSMRLARLTAQQLELYLTEAAALPAPFTGTGDPTVWTLDADAPLLSALELSAVPAPYPSLVTVGHDLDGAHVLLDLEHVGELAVDSDPDSTVAVLAALATELATSSWADDLQVTLVGCLQSLPAALGTGRVRYLPTLEGLLPALEHRAADVRSALQANGLTDLQQARTASADQHLHGDAWTPEILLLGGPVGPDARVRLDAVLHDLPHVGVAAVTAGDGGLSEWTLHLDDADASPDAVAVLAPVSLALRPQRLTAADLGQLLGLLAVADLPADTPHGNEAAFTGMVIDEPALADLGSQLAAVDEPVPTAIATVMQRPDNTGDTTGNGPVVILRAEPLARTTTERQPSDAEAAIPRPPPQQPSAAAVDEPARADADPVTAAGVVVDVDEVDAPGDPRPPLVQVLGPVDVLHPRGAVEPSKRRQLTEIATYLALHPGSDHHGLSEAIWPGARAVDNTRNTALSKLRKWLGVSDDGTDYVPRVGGDGYRLHPAVRTDWQLWQELLSEGPAVAGSEALAAALELVKGKPFAGTNPRRYAWAERDRQDMISAIVDVAHELARRALVEADATLARSAAAAGLQADPGAELLWRDALKAEWLAGDRDGLVTTADRLSALAEELGDDLEPETIALLGELLNRPAGQVGAR